MQAISRARLTVVRQFLENVSFEKHLKFESYSVTEVLLERVRI